MGKFLYSLLAILDFHHKLLRHQSLANFQVVNMDLETPFRTNSKHAISALVLAVGILPIIGYAWFISPASVPQAEEVIRHIPFVDQTMVVITAFLLKPLYMLISLVLAWVLRRSHKHELIILRWGLLAFFLGEAFCSINYLVFNDKSVFSEFLHSYGMVVSLGFIGYALLEGLDKYIIQYTHPDKQCAFISLCRECVKNQNVSCRARQLFQLASFTLAFLALLPLLAEIQETSYFSYIYSTLYNYTRLKAHLLFEIRYCPLVALVMFMTAFIVLLFSKEKQIPELARVSLSAGMGALGFGVFRLFLNSIFDQNLAWAAVWEEISEFSLMVTIAYILWLFRKPFHIVTN
jgi:hypothetical protein